ncbi:MAG: co-chaperone GroES [Syntrophobacterales bacterium CG_4_8_14_3_um_filter_58_8]|jgi:chaperonin GroES|nr:MAG: co-chaperone GroES [Syntrophaceae bacterium CG2_30_58_14]PIV04757.1 MAG: co-chaperone GroES [Syntrophobacterales bacterium CG03_land_8_20_14_0_80_58_14]PJC71951.1 MAG: co-chaperone GroES [Syntrophobacterales bacterium CG_4_8_14_3_um_filter_58_8]
MKIRPLQDRVIVKRIEEEGKTKGGIIIPDTAKEKPMEGLVISVGKGKTADDGKLIKPDVKAGDRILFGKYSGTEVKIDGDELLIMREDDILGILEK